MSELEALRTLELNVAAVLNRLPKSSRVRAQLAGELKKVKDARSAERAVADPAPVQRLPYKDDD